MAKIFNITPKPVMLRSIQRDRWSVSGALSELIDNSLGPKRGNASEVVIHYDQKRQKLIIADNGRGMDAIGRLFQHGNSIGRGIGDIGVYGAGGTKALLWLSHVAKVSTVHKSRLQTDSVKWSDWIEAETFSELGVTDEWKPMKEAPEKLGQWGHGTQIELWLPKGRKINPSNIVRDLSRIYSPGLRKGKKVTWVVDDREPLALTDPFAHQSALAKCVTFDIVLEFNGEHLPVYGRVFYARETSHAMSKVQVGYGHRIIYSTSDCYQSENGEEKYTGTGVSGWLDLGEGWQPYLTTTKDGIDDERLSQALMGYVFEQIKPLLKEAEDKTFSIEFDDIAVGLEKALNLKSGTITVMTNELPGQGGDGGIGGNRQGTSKPGQSDWEPGKTEKQAAPVFGVLIIKQTDVEMRSELCHAELSNDAVYVTINAEHDIVREAMKANPINRMALNLMVTREMASAICGCADSDHVIKKIFRAGAREITGIEAQGDRERAITRHLIDGIRTPSPEQLAS